MRLTQGTEAPLELDALDRGIIEILRRKRRATNQEIADQLSVSPAKVASRLRRLGEVHAMRVVAVTDFSMHDYHALAAVGVKVHGRCAREVAGELATLPQVLSVHLVNGAHDIELLVGSSRLASLNALLLQQVAAVEGVESFSAGLALDIVKFEFDVAPLSL
jgi:Lrp/AsnC family transcriptional regulator for asnA, asnC and gidA